MPPILLKPLGDAAVLAVLPDEHSALALAGAVQSAGWGWVEDIVPAYSNVGIYFDPTRTCLAAVREALAGLNRQAGERAVGKLHRIPCCYEMQLDLERVARHCGLIPSQVIDLHTSMEFTVFAIGFSPGFPYLGYLPNELAGVPRLAEPRKRVEPGSVGLTGRQTGIYPQARPGGWNILGRTPMELVNLRDNYFPIRTGDRIRFDPIDEEEFRRLQGQRL